MTKADPGQLLAAMLNKPLYVALREPRDLRRIQEFLPAHLEWAIQAERRGNSLLLDHSLLRVARQAQQAA